MGKVLLLSRSVVKGSKEDDEMAFVQFTACEPSLNAMQDALKWLCLR